MPNWSAEASRNLYNLEHWGEGYFDIDRAAEAVVRPHGPEGTTLSLNAVINDALEQGARLPMLLRFVDILGDRVKRLTEAFDRAISERGYSNGYTAVYPIKVNQRASVVEEIVRQGGDRIGLEAGSKPELMTILAMSEKPDGLIICNGYKDREYIRMALMGRLMGLQTMLVVEKLSELDWIIDEARALGVTPGIGVRLRLSSLGKGKWQNTGGEKAKFGLSARQLLELVEVLKKANLSQALQLLHFHMGSQISHVRDIQRGLGEAARYLVAFHNMGLEIRYMDVGGGLGVDYEGSGSRGYFSMNYGLSHYAAHVVDAVATACEEAGMPMPHLVTESGRAMTAHHAVLVSNVSAVEYLPEGKQLDHPASDNEHNALQGFRHLLKDIDQRPSIEAFHEAEHFLNEGQSLFMHGLIDLPQRACFDELFVKTCRHLQQRLQGRELNRSRQALLDELRYRLSDKIFCNFSVFRSTPDVWAIDQVFPIMPLQRLAEKPERYGIIEDLTCDSDGRIDHYVQDGGLESSLPIHRIDPAKESYRLAFFMVGAYQETLGDNHNLFGRPDAVDIRSSADGQWQIIRQEQGNSAEQLLLEVGYQPQQLMRQLQARIGKTVNQPERAKMIEQALEKSLRSYTYLKA